MAEPSIKKNFAYKLVYEILVIIIPFITAPYISRVLGADGVGTYSYVQANMYYFTMFAALGTGSYGMREISRRRADRSDYSKTFWEIELVTVFTTIICLIAWLVFVFLSNEYRLFYIALIPTLIACIFDISWLYTGLEKINYTVIINMLCKIIGTICIFVFIKTKNDLYKYILLNSTISLLGNISMWVFLPRLLLKTNIDVKNIKTHFKETLVYFIPTIAASIYTVLDKTLIGVITNDSYQNGYYEQATKIVNMAKTVSFVALNSVMGARLSYLFVGDHLDEIKQRTCKSLNIIMFLAIGCSFGISAVAKTFVPLYFGEGYEPTITLLYILSPIIVIIGISNCIGTHYYSPAGKVKLGAVYMIIGSIANLICNLLLIPSLGANGAAIGSIIAETIITILFVKYDDGIVSWKDIFLAMYKKIIAGIIMMGVVVYCSKLIMISSIVKLFIEIAIGVIVYLLCLLLMKDELVIEYKEKLFTRIKKI